MSSAYLDDVPEKLKKLKQELRSAMSRKSKLEMCIERKLIKIHDVTEQIEAATVDTEQAFARELVNLYKRKEQCDVMRLEEDIAMAHLLSQKFEDRLRFKMQMARRRCEKPSSGKSVLSMVENHVARKKPKKNFKRDMKYKKDRRFPKPPGAKRAIAVKKEIVHKND